MMQNTRQRILEILREERQATVEDLARRLGLTPMTIRHHLNVLQAQNLVVASQVRRSTRVGRPRLVYTLTETADDLFPQNHGLLANYLLDEIKEMLPEQEVRAMFRRIAARLASEAPPPEPDQSFEERLRQVAEFLERQGFLTRWERTEDGYVLTNVNCPYRQVSRRHREPCLMDAELLFLLMGVTPQPLGGKGAGDAPCRYLLTPPRRRVHPG